jgi:hypothetical protein
MTNLNQGEILPQFKKFQEELVENFRKQNEELKKVIQQVAQFELPLSTKQLAEFGWFITFDFSVRDVYELSNYLEAGEIEKIDSLMVSYFESNSKKIRDRLVERFPNRENIIIPVFKAHKRKEYYLSVPVFLSQSDGICKELIKVSLFGGNPKNDFKPWTNEFAKQCETESIYGLMLEPLKHKGGFNKHQSEYNHMGISRHDILHGSSTDYGTKVMSCKAMSLLNYSGDWIYHALIRQEINNR